MLYMWLSETKNVNDNKTTLEMQKICKYIWTALTSYHFLYLTYKLEVWPMNSEAKYATFLFPSRQLSGDKEIDPLCSQLMHACLTVFFMSHGHLPQGL